MSNRDAAILRYGPFRMQGYTPHEDTGWTRSKALADKAQEDRRRGESQRRLNRIAAKKAREKQAEELRAQEILAQRKASRAGYRDYLRRTPAPRDGSSTREGSSVRGGGSVRSAGGSRRGGYRRPQPIEPLAFRRPGGDGGSSRATSADVGSALLSSLDLAGGFGTLAQQRPHPMHAAVQPSPAPAPAPLAPPPSMGKPARPAYTGPKDSTPYAQQNRRTAANSAVPPAKTVDNRPTTADLLRKLKAAAELPWEQDDSGGSLLFAYVERLAAENGHRSSQELLRAIHSKLGHESSPQREEALPRSAEAEPLDRVGPMRGSVSGHPQGGRRQHPSRASREEAALIESLEHLEGRLASLHQADDERARRVLLRSRRGGGSSRPSSRAGTDTGALMQQRQRERTPWQAGPQPARAMSARPASSAATGRNWGGRGGGRGGRRGGRMGGRGGGVPTHVPPKRSQLPVHIGNRRARPGQPGWVQQQPQPQPQPMQQQQPLQQQPPMQQQPQMYPKHDAYARSDVGGMVHHNNDGYSETQSMQSSPAYYESLQHPHQQPPPQQPLAAQRQWMQMQRLEEEEAARQRYQQDRAQLAKQQYELEQHRLAVQRAQQAQEAQAAAQMQAAEAAHQRQLREQAQKEAEARRLVEEAAGRKAAQEARLQEERLEMLAAEERLKLQAEEKKRARQAAQEAERQRQAAEAAQREREAQEAHARQQVEHEELAAAALEQAAHMRQQREGAAASQAARMRRQRAAAATIGAGVAPGRAAHYRADVLRVPADDDHHASSGSSLRGERCASEFTSGDLKGVSASMQVRDDALSAMIAATSSASLDSTQELQLLGQPSPPQGEEEQGAMGLREPQPRRKWAPPPPVVAAAGQTSELEAAEAAAMRHGDDFVNDYRDDDNKDDSDDAYVDDACRGGECQGGGLAQAKQPVLGSELARVRAAMRNSDEQLRQSQSSNAPQAMDGGGQQGGAGGAERLLGAQSEIDELRDNLGLPPSPARASRIAAASLAASASSAGSSVDAGARSSGGSSLAALLQASGGARSSGEGSSVASGRQSHIFLGDASDDDDDDGDDDVGADDDQDDDDDDDDDDDEVHASDGRRLHALKDDEDKSEQDEKEGAGVGDSADVVLHGRYANRAAREALLLDDPSNVGYGPSSSLRASLRLSSTTARTSADSFATARCPQQQQAQDPAADPEEQQQGERLRESGSGGGGHGVTESLRSSRSSNGSSGAALPSPIKHGVAGSRTNWANRQSQLLSSLDLAGAHFPEQLHSNDPGDITDEGHSEDQEDEEEEQQEEDEEGADDGLVYPGAAGRVGGSPRSSLLPGWTTHYDGETRSFYYYHKASGESRWERPSKRADSDDDPGEAEAGGAVEDGGAEAMDGGELGAEKQTEQRNGEESTQGVRGGLAGELAPEPEPSAAADCVPLSPVKALSPGGVGGGWLSNIDASTAPSSSRGARGSRSSSGAGAVLGSVAASAEMQEMLSQHTRLLAQKAEVERLLAARDHRYSEYSSKDKGSGTAEAVTDGGGGGGQLGAMIDGGDFRGSY